MERDLSLIEIDNEDDSLLQQITNDKRRDVDFSTVAVDFSCSPIQTLGSANHSSISTRIPPAEALKDDGDAKKICSPSSKDTSNKENLNGNNLSAKRFVEESLQIKRRKKGGGYNLRKSLAWNRAFFTEQGVLDPLELSLLSGPFNKSFGELLPPVSEEGRKSTDSELVSDAGHLPDLEQDLSKELLARPLNDDKNGADDVLTGSDSLFRGNVAPVGVVSRKLQIAKGNRSASKRGVCPRPSGSSSQKRLPNIITTSATPKDSKLPKYSASNSNSASLPATVKHANAVAKSTKSKRIANAAADIKKYNGSKGFSNNIKSASNNTNYAPGRLPLSVKPSISGKLMGNSSSETNLSANSESLLDRKLTVTGLKVTTDSLFPENEAHALNSHDGSSKVMGSLPLNSHYAVGKIQNVGSQTTKPSGLRVPSPSLGFFGTQPKAPSLLGQASKNTQPCNLPKPNMSNIRKLSPSTHIGELKLDMPGRPHKSLTNITRTANIEGSSPTMKNLMQSVATPLHQTMKATSDLNKLQKMKVKVSFNPKDYSDQITNHVSDDVDKKFQEPSDSIKLESCEIEKISDTELGQMNDKKSLIHSESPEQYKKDADCDKLIGLHSEGGESKGNESEDNCFLSHPSSGVQVEDLFEENDVNMHLVEETQSEPLHWNQSVEDHEFKCDLQYGDSIKRSIPGTSVVHNYCLKVDCDMDKQLGVEADVITAGPYQAKHILHKENLREKANDNTLLKQSRSLEEPQKDNDCGNQFDVCPLHQSQISSEIQVRLGAAEIDQMISHIEYAQLPSLVGNSFIENCDSSPINLNMHDGYLRVIYGADEECKDKIEPIITGCDEVQVLHDDHRQQLRDELLLTQSRPAREQQKNCFHDKVINVTGERRDFCGSKLESSVVFPLVAPAVQEKEGASAGEDNRINAKIMQDAQLESINVDPLVQNHALLSDSQCRFTINLRDQGASSGSESTLELCKDLRTGATDALSVEVVSSSSELSILEENKLGRDVSPEKIQRSNILDTKFQNELENVMLQTSDKGATMPFIRKSVNDKNQDAPSTKPHLNAPPFSDEWLAALEAAGEEILTMKTGAVQNSPPDKSLPEPSPWSPVKRKSNQDIGPFDCTKYTNPLPPNSQ